MDEREMDTAAFDALMEQRLEPMLARPPHEFHREAIALLQEAMPTMRTRADRGEAYHWLGLMHHVAAAEAFRAEDNEGARGAFALMEEFLAKSIEELPEHLASRKLLARFYLTFGEDPAAAAELLDIPAEWLRDMGAREPALEHEWLGLRGVACALSDDSMAAMMALDAAYSERFVGVLAPGEVDVSPIEFLLRRGIGLEGSSARALHARLLEFGLSPDARVVQALARMAGI